MNDHLARLAVRLDRCPICAGPVESRGSPVVADAVRAQLYACDHCPAILLQAYIEGDHLGTIVQQIARHCERCDAGCWTRLPPRHTPREHWPPVRCRSCAEG